MPKANDKDVYYFSHDCNARNDEKVLALRSVYGLEGYAVYFMLIEILREQPTYRLPITKYTYNTLAMQMQCKCSKVEQIVHDCCSEFVNENSSLLTIEDGFLFSDSLLRRMGKVDSTSESRSKAASARWEKEKSSKSNANAQQLECYKKRIEETKPDKKKEKKEEKEIQSNPAWAAFVEMRKKIKKPMSDRAISMALSDLEKLAPGDLEKQAAILDQSTFHCWQGLFELKGDANGTGAYIGSNPSSSASRPGNTETVKPKYGNFV